MSNGYIYNAVYRNSTKKAIYKAVMEHVNKTVNRRIEKFLSIQERREKLAERSRTRATGIALQWEKENTKREVVKVLKTLIKKGDGLYITKAHNNAIELAIRHVKKEKIS